MDLALEEGRSPGLSEGLARQGMRGSGGWTSFVALGVGHILGGIDPMLFLVGFLVARRTEAQVPAWALEQE